MGNLTNRVSKHRPSQRRSFVGSRLLKFPETERETEVSYLDVSTGPETQRRLGVSTFVSVVVPFYSVSSLDLSRISFLGRGLEDLTMTPFDCQCLNRRQSFRFCCLLPLSFFDFKQRPRQ